MKKILFAAFLILASLHLHAQTVTGKVVDQTNTGLANVSLQLYINPNVFNAFTGSDGTFTISDVTMVAEESLPLGYSIADNYPNPFNPRTRFEITLPARASVRADIFNVLGKQVSTIAERIYQAGTSFLDVELNGNPNGFYIARIMIDGRYTAVRKMLLLYGSRHLAADHSSGAVTRLAKSGTGASTLDVKIDSLVATTPSMVRTVFASLPPLSGSSVNLGTLVVNLPVPDPPVLLMPADNAMNLILAIQLLWNVCPNTICYTLQISADSTFAANVTTLGGLTDPGQQVTGLKSDTHYYWRVKAVNAYGSSAWSGVRSFTTGNNPPFPPANPIPSNKAVDVPPGVSFWWMCTEPDGDSLKFDVFMGTDSSAMTQVAKDLTDRTYLPKDFAFNTTYYWQVVAKDGKGLTTTGPVWKLTILLPKLEAPAHFQIVSLTDTLATLSWTDNCYIEEGVLIEQSSDGTNFTVVDTAAANMTTVSVPGSFENGRFYSFRARTLSGADRSPYSNVATAGKGVTVFGNFSPTEGAFGITADASGNLFVSMMSSGVGIGIRKYLIDADSAFSYAPAGGVAYWSGLKIGPGGALLGARRMRAVFTIPQNSNSVLWAQVVTSSINDLDFDNHGGLWAVGNNANIFRFKVSDKSVVSFPFQASLRSVRVYNDYLYVAGSHSTSTDTTEGVWRFPINADGTLGASELFFNLTQTSGSLSQTANAITFNTDGEMYLGTNVAPWILVVSPDGKTCNPLYPGFFQHPVITLAWGRGGTIFALSNESDTYNGNKLLKISTNKTSAPYYGRQQ